MTYPSSSTLPPPAVFLHQETLHAILLPPLASWLTSLRKPEHLVRLSDLLERYKTPKSYHRVDVRLVESSELPPGSPDSQREDDPPPTEESQADRNRARKGSREIIELNQGIQLEDYWKDRLGFREGSRSSTRPVVRDGLHSDIIRNEDKLQPQMQSEPKTNTLEQEDDESIHPDIQQTEAALNTLAAATTLNESDQPPIPSSLLDKSPNSQDAHDQLPQTPPSTIVPMPSDHESPPTPSHPLPPMGPKRKVRELRLDLRTLDAAALFALETWRREELGMEKLNMDVPDSVWYKDPTPSPPPPPTSSLSRKGRPGRPRRSLMSDAVSSPPNEEEGLGLDLHIGEKTMEVEQYHDVDIDMTEGSNEGFGDPVIPLFPEKGLVKHENSVEIPTAPSILDSFSALAQQSLIADMEVVRPSLDETALEVIGADASRAQFDEGTTQSDLTVVEPIQLEAGPSRFTTPPAPAESIHSASPDIVLNDIFNEKEDDDPDFIPPPSPPARRQTRARKYINPPSEVAMDVEKKGKHKHKAARVSFDPNIIEILEREKTKTKTPEVFLQSSRRGSKSKDDGTSKDGDIEATKVEEVEEMLQREDIHPIVLLSVSPEPISLPQLPNPSAVVTELNSLAKRPRASDIEVSSKKPRKSASNKARSQVVVEIPSRKVEANSDDEEEEWGFLRSFG
ncbi:uncharacterized protein IL334_003116 [Kwoniella shivajii]|uniref:DNA replication regulator Sld3 C-terminal domain-containing protein n=1 Tax=Kwoniella shivajii TaxID=564305 RepID=A0ABZ1CX75_9TREE|nr:hypothetical protein IL334_003116 [Kwoniella shivajii]